MSTKSSPKRIEKESSDNGLISFDLLANLTYMASVSAGGSPRDLILEWTLKQDYRTVRYFRQVYILAKRAGFEYSRAYQLVARKTKATTMRSLLLRFAGAISSGYPEQEFLKEEAKVNREQYINSYYRSLETVTKWGDAYAALLVSVSLVVVVSMISTMLSDLSDTFVIVLAFTMFSVTGMGVFIIYRTSPSEIKTYKYKYGPKTRQLAVKFFYYFVPAGACLALIIAFAWGLGPAFLLLGFALLPSGFMAWRDDQQLDKIDQETSTFIRSLGNVSASLGSTVANALRKLDKASMGTLEPYIERLQIRLSSHISPDKCWDAFRDECGAELMNRTTRIFADGVALGGSPETVGALAAEYSMDAALMRSRRNVSAAPFAFLTIPLHFAMTGLMIFILEIMKSFNDRITQAVLDLEAQTSGGTLAALPALPVFQPHNMTMITVLTMCALVAYTISNALAPKFAKGGHPLNIAGFGAITCILTGFNLVIVPPIASGILLAS